MKGKIDRKNNEIEVKVVRRAIITLENVAILDLEGKWITIAD